MRHFVCDHCQQPLEWSWRIGGTRVRCVRCGGETLAPVLEVEFIPPKQPVAERPRGEGLSIARVAWLFFLMTAISGTVQIVSSVVWSRFNFLADPPARMSREEERQFGERMLERSRLAKRYQESQKVVDESALPAANDVGPLFPSELPPANEPSP